MKNIRPAVTSSVVALAVSSMVLFALAVVLSLTFADSLSSALARHSRGWPSRLELLAEVEALIVAIPLLSLNVVAVFGGSRPSTYVGNFATAAALLIYSMLAVNGKAWLDDRHFSLHFGVTLFFIIVVSYSYVRTYLWSFHRAGGP